MSRFVLTHRIGERTAPPGLFSPGEYRAVSAFFSGLGAPSTPLHDLRDLAASLGVRNLLVKDESARLSLDAFKILGVTYAVERLLDSQSIGSAATLACATAGNHGRAVARIARNAGFACVAYVPRHTVRTRIEAIASEGARVVVFEGTYDEAVRQLVTDATHHGWTIVSDTSWEGYEQIPRWIMAGYTRLMDEAAAAWPTPPDVVLVQAGVGGLACAIASWTAAHLRPHRPFVIVCEPVDAACVLESARAGRAAILTGPLDTTMAGLRCAAPSPLALGPILDIADGFVALEDRWAFDAMRRLAEPAGADPRILAGASGACGVAALMALLQDPELREVRDACRLGRTSSVLAINTEGITEPDLWDRVTAGGR